MEQFYATIFGSVLAIFGLLLAATLFVAQLVETRHSSGRAQALLSGRFAAGFWAAGVATLSFSGIAILVLASLPPSHALSVVVLSWQAGIFALSLTLLTLLLFVRTLNRYVGAISPLAAISDLQRDLKPTEVRALALYRLNVEPPRHAGPEHIIRELDQDGLERLRAVLGDQVDIEQLRTAAEQAKREARGAAEQQDNITSEKTRLSSLDARGALSDPITDLSAIAFAQISTRNIHAWRAAILSLRDFLCLIPDDILAEHATVPFHGDTLILTHFRELADEALSASRNRMAEELVAACGFISSHFASKGHLRRSHNFLGFLRTLGIRSARTGSDLVSIACIRAVAAVAADHVQRRETRDEATRCIGQIGEESIRAGIRRPGSIAFDDDSPLAEIAEAIYRVSSAIERADPAIYPSILMDIIEVICDGVLRDDDGHLVETRVLSMIGDYVDLTVNTLRREHESSDLLLGKCLRYLSSVLQHDLRNYRELRPDIYIWYRDIALATVQHNQRSRNAIGTFADEARDLQGIVLYYLARLPDREQVAAEMRELYIKGIGVEGREEFLRRAARLLDSTFGMNLHP
jgi:hypothetical protein